MPLINPAAGSNPAGGKLFRAYSDWFNNINKYLKLQE